MISMTKLCYPLQLSFFVLIDDFTSNCLRGGGGGGAKEAIIWYEADLTLAPNH